MKSLPLLILPLVLTSLSGCYSVEDAANVNQDRIRAEYCTVFNGTYGTTKAVINFRFGQTPLRLSNPMYFAAKRLSEQQDILFGLHYARTLDGVATGSYEWTDENGVSYHNEVQPYAFELTQPITELQKFTYYKLAWTGQQIPYENGDFTITLTSLESNYTVSFSAGELLEIHSDNLENMPDGRARMTIARQHSESVDETTQAGGHSTVSFERVYVIRIIP